MRNGVALSMQTTQLTLMARIVLTAVAVTMGTYMAARAEDAPAKAAPQEPKADAPVPPPPAAAKDTSDAKPGEPKSETKAGKPPFAVVLKDGLWHALRRNWARGLQIHSTEASATSLSPWNTWSVALTCVV